MKRLIISMLVLMAIASMTAQEVSEFLAQPIENYEYIYVNASNDSITVTKKPYLILHAGKIVDGKVVSTSIAEKECEIERELFQFADDKYVIFDYALQVGDTLNVILESIGCACIGNTTTYWVYYKHIEVESIDAIVHNGIERLRYNLKSKLYGASIEYGYTTPNGEQPREEDYFERILEPVELSSLEEQWIEGVGYTTNIENIHNDNPEIYTLQCAFDKGENIYTAEGANCDGLSDNLNHKIDFSTLTLHRSGDMLVAVFPTAGAGEAITLYDATGRVVAVQPIREGATTASINVANLPKGICIARLNSGVSEKVAL